MRLNKGFTLIELLVVIAIIGILSSVVLASLNTARTRAVDAAIKNDMAQVRNQAELVYNNSTPHSYAGICASPQITAITTHATALTAGARVCNNAADAYAISVPLKSAGHWCVDGFFNGRTIPNPLGNGVTQCP